MLEFFVSGPPCPKQRPRLAKKVVFTPAKTKVYEKLIRLACLAEAKAKQWRADAKPVRVSLELSVKSLASMRADIDNLAKSVLDGMNGIAYIDDNQVVELHAHKFYQPNAPVGVRVKVERL